MVQDQDGEQTESSADDLPEPQVAASGQRTWWVIGGISAVMVVAGGALWMFGGDGGSPPSPSGAAGFAPGVEGGDSSGDGTSGWSPLFVKGGFSLFLGFCVGYALRTFFKISAFVIGLLGLCLFGLSYAEVVDVDWSAMDQYFDQFVDKVKEEAGEFKSFMTGSLPSAALAATGLVAGFRRK